MIIGLFPNEMKSHSLGIASEVCSFLKKRGVEVVADDLIAAKIGARLLSTLNPQEIDIRISLGGDGTILRLVHKHPQLNCPLLGINLGSLGFLADIPLDEIYPSLEDLINGNYSVQNRMMMEGRTDRDGLCLAVNEFVIHRAQNPCLIDLAIHVDGQYLNTFSADGIILSTPTGSTAYSLAAGGPIVSPEIDAYIITPICPHTISNRPIVLMPKQSIKIQYISHYHPLEISYDGISTLTLSSQESFYVKTSKEKFPLIHLSRHNYFHTLREKMGWYGKLKTSDSPLSLK